MLADLTHVPESALRKMSARAHSSVADEESAVECECINQELERRLRAMERRFGIDMAPEID